jgi:hypothetical protein
MAPLKAVQLVIDVLCVDEAYPFEVVGTATTSIRTEWSFPFSSNNSR